MSTDRSDLRQQLLEGVAPERRRSSALMEQSREAEEVIPGEDLQFRGRHFRDLTSATFQALLQPPHLRREAVAEMFNRCRVRGWRLLIQRDQHGAVIRALAVKEEVEAAMRQAAEESSPYRGRQVIVMSAYPSSAQRRLVSMDAAEAAQLQGGAPSMTRDRLYLNRQEFEWEIDDAGE